MGDGQDQEGHPAVRLVQGPDGVDGTVRLVQEGGRDVTGWLRDLGLVLEGMLIYRTVYEFLWMKDELRKARRERKWRE